MLGKTLFRALENAEIKARGGELGGHFRFADAPGSRRRQLGMAANTLAEYAALGFIIDFTRHRLNHGIEGRVLFRRLFHQHRCQGADAFGEFALDVFQLQRVVNAGTGLRGRLCGRGRYRLCLVLGGRNRCHCRQRQGAGAIGIERHLGPAREARQEIFTRLRTLAFVGAQGPIDGRQEVGGVNRAVTRFNRRLLRIVAQTRGGIDRFVAGHHPVHHPADRVQIRPWALHAGFAVLLDGRIAGTDDGSQLFTARRGTCRTEIQQDRAAVAANVDVTGLEIAMQIAAFMDDAEALDQRKNDLFHRRLR